MQAQSNYFVIVEKHMKLHTIQQGEIGELRDELSDLLFAMIYLLQLIGMDAEQMLTQANL
jgi:NTP pyrophosphatase (non-canonical NTP hydrolase)